MMLDRLPDMLVPLGFSVVIYIVAYGIVKRGFHWLEECGASDRQEPPPEQANREDAPRKRAML